MSRVGRLVTDGDEVVGVELLSHDAYLSRSRAKPHVTLLWKQARSDTRLDSEPAFDLPLELSHV